MSEVRVRDKVRVMCGVRVRVRIGLVMDRVSQW